MVIVLSDVEKKAPRRFQEFRTKSEVPQFQKEYIMREYAEMVRKLKELQAKNEQILKEFRERQARVLRPPATER